MILFQDRDIIRWLQDPIVDFEFMTSISPDTAIVKCIYSLLVPCILTTFDPDTKAHLREIEECNGLPEGTIAKVCWIKLMLCLDWMSA